MKTAATGDIQWVEVPNNIDSEKTMRLVLCVQSEKAEHASKVCLDLTDGGLCYLMDNLRSLALKRADAHDAAAQRLRATP